MSSDPGEWIETTGIQDNHWVAQVVSSCDLTPGTTRAYETIDSCRATYVYRFEGDANAPARVHDQVHEREKAIVTVVISNLPTGDLQYLDADYVFRLLGSSGSGRD